MKILLTGGSGFIGKNILESFLADKYTILAPTHSQLDLTDEVKVKNFFKKNNIDVVIHAAGKPGHRNAKDINSIFYTDMRIFLNLFKNQQSYKKMIILGSGAIYDQRLNISKIKEEEYNDRLPVDEHALYRYTVANLIEGNHKFIELRLFGVFGKYEDYAIRFVSNAICKTLFNLPITIRQNRRFDYLYVKDLFLIMDYFLNNNSKHKSYNVTPDSSVELLALAEEVKKISGKDIPIIVQNSGFGLEYSGNNIRLHGEFKGLNLTPYTEAIKELYNWYSEHKNSINKDSLLIDK